MNKDHLCLQEAHWDTESLKPGYFKYHIEALDSQGCSKALLKCIKKAGVRNPKRILELGGGSQYLSRRLSELFPEAQIICTDLSVKRMQDSNAYYGSLPDNFEVVGGVEASSLPFADGEFDLIVGDAVLHHVPHMKKALFEINRCLSSCGKAIFTREPVIGELGLLAYRLFQFSHGLNARHIDLNRLEYKKTLTQWKYEFIMSGFSYSVVNWWPGQSIMSRIRAIIPTLFPCGVAFALRKKTDI